MSDIGSAQAEMAKALGILKAFPPMAMEGAGTLVMAISELSTDYDRLAVVDAQRLLDCVSELSDAICEVNSAWVAFINAMRPEARFEAEGEYLDAVDALRRVVAKAAGLTARAITITRTARSKRH